MDSWPKGLPITTACPSQYFTEVSETCSTRREHSDPMCLWVPDGRKTFYIVFLPVGRFLKSSSLNYELLTRDWFSCSFRFQITIPRIWLFFCKTMSGLTYYSCYILRVFSWVVFVLNKGFGAVQFQLVMVIPCPLLRLLWL